MLYFFFFCFCFFFFKQKTAYEMRISDWSSDVCSSDLMGCSWFALSHHIDFLAAPDRGVRVHNYPEEWALWFDEQRLGVTDPVHRESQRSMSGFLWHNMKTERPEEDRKSTRLNSSH